MRDVPRGVIQSIEEFLVPPTSLTGFAVLFVFQHGCFSMKSNVCAQDSNRMALLSM